MAKVVDCFTFYNELDMLTYRMSILDSVVDYFVIVEATHAHVGKRKPLYFNENKNLYQKFADKIIHVVVDDMPHKEEIHGATTDAWINERFQRAAISRGIDRIYGLNDNDIIIISDLDEIPDPRTLNKIKRGEITVSVNLLNMDFYYYNLNTKILNEWGAAKIYSYSKYKELRTYLSCNDLRMVSCPAINEGGWHLSYFGDEYFIRNKLLNFAHQEYNNPYYTDPAKIKERVERVGDLFERNLPFVYVDINRNPYLPVDYERYLSKYYEK